MPAGETTGKAEKTRGLLEVHLAVFLFGFPGLFGKWLALSPPLIVLGRVFFASLALAVVLWLGRRPMKIAPARDMALLVLCGLVLAAHWTMFFQAVRVSTVAVALLSYSSFPIFAAFLEPLAFRERRDPAGLLAAIVCVIGVFLIVPGFGLANPVLQGVLWGLGSGLTFAVLALLNRKLAEARSSLLVAFYQDLFALVFLAPFAFVSKVELTGRTLGLLAVLGVFGTAAAHTLFIGGLKRVRVRTASIISTLEPVYGIALAALFLKESPAPRTLAGGALILTAALVITARAARTD